ncbi:MAG TPA: isoprenyl synthetase [Cytophagales bacterium]|nr:isoprenyl synthetase [Cytophagales bacterium]
MELNDQLKVWIEDINQYLKDLRYGSYPEELYEPIGYMMTLGGKRLRPLLTLLGYQLYHDDIQSVMPAAAAVEVFHNFTLMHDDIMDKAPLRRGQETVHTKWDDNVAILSGDVMLVRAYDLLMNIKDEYLKRAVASFNKTGAEVCEGQQIDMNFESRDDVTVEEYIDMIRRKTAVLLGFALELGAMLGGAHRHEQKLLYRFGVNMGIGFQLKDDLLDVYADQAKFGKQVGGDIISNKKTFLLIEAQKRATGEHKATLDKWLAATEFDAAEKVAAVTAVYDALGIRELTEAKVEEYFTAADDAFEVLKAPDEKKALVKNFADWLMARDK